MTSGGTKILIIDDQKSLVWGLEKSLSEKGFIVEAVYDGIKGEEQVRTGKYDIVIMDLRLPGKSGLEILEATARSTEAQFILISAFATAEDAEKAALLGARDFLPKPFDPEELFERIMQILQEDKKIALKEKVKWMTLPCPYPVRIDMFYKEKTRLWVDVFGKADRLFIVVAEKMSSYEMGYLSALLSAAKDLKDMEHFLEQISFRLLKEKVLALVDTTHKDLLFFGAQGRAFLLKKEGAFSLTREMRSFNNEDSLFFFDDDSGLSEEYKDLLTSFSGIDKDFYGISREKVNRIKEKINAGSMRGVLAVSFHMAGDQPCIEEDFSPDSLTREEIVRFMSSLPPSQKMSEEQRNMFDLFLCELITTINPKVSGSGLKVICCMEEKAYKSFSFVSSGSPLLEKSAGEFVQRETIEEIADTPRRDISSYILNTLFKQKRLEVAPDKKKLTYYL